MHDSDIFLVISSDCLPTEDEIDYAALELMLSVFIT